MIPIVDYEECKKLINEARAKKGISNCFFLPNQIQEFIKKGNLFYIKSSENLFFLEKENDFYRIYYFLVDSTVLTNNILALDLPVVIEYPYKNKLTEKQRNEIYLIEKLGLHLGRESARMCAKPNNLSIINNSVSDGLNIKYADIDETDIIEHNLNNTFDKIYAFLPNTNELKKIIEEKRILTAYYKNDLVGIINMEICKNTAWIRHIMVSKAYRGKGVGWILLNEYHKLFKDNVNEFMHWVDLDNKSAISMYKKAGYSFDGRMANEYVKTT